MAENRLNILTICGSLRKKSYNGALLRALPALAPTNLAFTPAPPYGGIPLYNFDVQSEHGFPAEVLAWSDAIRAADGILIASPEFNWSIPGPLKNVIDWASRQKDQPFKDKPVALQSAATGPLGGGRMQQHLRVSLTGIDALVFGRPEVIVTFAPQKFDEATGELKDEPTREIIRTQLAGFAAFVAKVCGKGS